MDTSKLYIPNASLWINFFKKKRQETVNQSGGGPKILPINELTKESDESSTQPAPMEVELVSPVQAATNRVIKQVKRRRKRTRRSTIKNKRKQKRSQRKKKLRKGKKKGTATKKKKKKIIRRKMSRDIFD